MNNSKLTLKNVMLLIAVITAFTGLYYLKPVITGLVIASEEITYSDEINLIVNERSDYIWQLNSTLPLKSIKISGSVEAKGIAKVYIENNGISYLVFDKSRLDKKGILDITGLAINKNEISDKKSNENSYQNISTDEEIVNEIIIDLLNQTQINKSIKTNLEYNKETGYDSDNDGIEPISGVIDFTVKNTEFDWEVDESKLCTIWETYSIEDEKSTTVCYGSNECCSFVDLSPNRQNWSEPLYSYYGLYGATINNIIS